MLTVSGEFVLLMQRLNDGSEDAARELLDRYGHHVIRVVRRRLHKSLRARFDSQDFVQAVWASLFESRDRMLEFERPAELIAFLVAITTNKVIDGCRRYLNAEGSNPTRECSLENLAHDRDAALVSKVPTPSEYAVGNELQDRLDEVQPQYYQRILQMRGEGASLEEIAAELGVAERTVRRVLDELRRRFKA